MSTEDFDHLFDTPSTDKADEAPAAPVVPTVPILRMAVFRPGAEVQYRGRRCTVSHTVLRRGELRVKLNEEHDDILADHVVVALTSFSLLRVH